MNKREQQLYQEHLTRLRVRLKDTELLHTPDGEVGPLERGFTSATSPEDFKGWVVGFCNEQSDELAKLPEMLADAQVARSAGDGPHTGGPKDRLVGWRTW